ncbi:hypothetical protein ACFQPF_16145 [Fictibacillus iocasae]|uniref:CxxH/CxxC protein n=1 Tax=Fictibacillus iocasae TaxID=2715437 RepID=A0ABW2NVB7_9BACL
MAMYLVDHSKNMVHRTAFIKTECDHQEISKESVEHLNDAKSVELLLSNKQYDYCQHCSQNNI